MPYPVHVHFLPKLVEPETLANSTVVVLDILRASTTITTALVNGAKEVIPCGEVDEAKSIAAKLPDGTFLLGGERGGLLIPGFDAGNSPAEYPVERVKGKSIIFTTTNGTAAMLRCKLANEILIGSFVNLDAICERLSDASAKRAIHILCAGTGGVITREDVLCGGAMVAQLFGAAGECENHSLNDQAILARDAWQFAMNTTKSNLTLALQDTQGGRNLRGLGLQSDIALAAALNQFTAVPVLSLRDWRITI